MSGNQPKNKVYLKFELIRVHVGVRTYTKQEPHTDSHKKKKNKSHTQLKQKAQEEQSRSKLNKKKKKEKQLDKIEGRRLGEWPTTWENNQ